MQSPLFIFREREIRRLFRANDLLTTWKRSVRLKMKQQLLDDPIELLDFHSSAAQKCSTLARQIRAGVYVPSASRRVLVEKSRGICRQIVIPSIPDAIVLQRLSNALYADIRGKEPTDRAFFEPEDHRFSSQDGSVFARPQYGSMKAWLDFQERILKFTKEHDFIVVTDIANYYDCISYIHLRNILSSTIKIREPVLDMLIFTLAGLLWQPDYMPHVEIGLPQIDLDAPRLLAHCFLYELDKYIVHKFGADYVRYMDDIDLGVDSYEVGMTALRNIDLALHTRQIRLNTGKTKILTRFEAIAHFCIRENHIVSILQGTIDKRIKGGFPVGIQKQRVLRLLSRWHQDGRFDRDNGEKILKRLLGMCYRLGIVPELNVWTNALYSRSACRELCLRTVLKAGIDPTAERILLDLLKSGRICDEATFLHISTAIVEAPMTNVTSGRRIARSVAKLMRKDTFFHCYAKLWLASKCGQPQPILKYLVRTFDLWRADPWLGRVVGGLLPLFDRSPQYTDYLTLIQRAINHGATDVLQFHQDIRIDKAAYNRVKPIIRATNSSMPLGISHPKFLVLLSVLASPHVSDGEKTRLIVAHKIAWRDALYRALARKAIIPTRLRSLIAS